MSLYLDRYAFREKLIKPPPRKDLGLVVAIPAFKEMDLVRSLMSLHNCKLPPVSVEVIVVINQSSSAQAETTVLNLQSYQSATDWVEKNNTPELSFYLLYVDDLPTKHAGVGLARKIAMDEAVRRLESVGRTNGIIACFDADSVCDPSYLVELFNHFDQNKDTPACSIYFEHPLEGKLDSWMYEAITDYELFLRYYVQGLRYASFPLAFHTIGSSMAVRSDAYQKQGGMNRRKAGEDFYFLQRMFRLGNFTELNTTRIIPSPRISDRVPFGTGKAVADWQSNQRLEGYDPQIFDDLRPFISKVPELLKSQADKRLDDLPRSVLAFLGDNGFNEELDRIRSSSSTFNGFMKLFYHWFDGFKVLKYVHFARDHFYPNLSIHQSAGKLLKRMGQNTIDQNRRELLITYRKLNKMANWP